MNFNIEDNNKAQQFLESLKVAAKDPEAIEQYGDKTLSITICCFWSYCSSRTR